MCFFILGFWNLAVSYKLFQIFISIINLYRDFGAPSSSEPGVDRTPPSYATEYVTSTTQFGHADILSRLIDVKLEEFCIIASIRLEDDIEIPLQAASSLLPVTVKSIRVTSPSSTQFSNKSISVDGPPKWRTSLTLMFTRSWHIETRYR